MRSYRQYCGLAKALEVVGDRWTLLIVRELLIQGACRYKDLQYGLPGIATNLLAKRLRDLEHAGLIARVTSPPPAAADLFELTPRGRELEAVLAALGQWGDPLMDGASSKDIVRSHWLPYVLEHCLRDQAPDQPPVAIELRAGRETMFVETAGGAIEVRWRAARCPVAAVLTGKLRSVFDLLIGKLNLARARAAGVRYEGDVKVLGRVQPKALLESTALPLSPTRHREE
jgi:DNA-binding HxlR family transcriptional regulator